MPTLWREVKGIGIIFLVGSGKGLFYMVGCLEICDAACCRGMKQVRLGVNEFERLKSQGWELHESYDDPNVYKVYKPCPWTEGNRCSVRNQPDKRFGACGMPFMGRECRGLRVEHPEYVKIYLPGEPEKNYSETFGDIDWVYRLKMLGASLLGYWPWGLEGATKPNVPFAPKIPGSHWSETYWWREKGRLVPADQLAKS